MAMRYRVTELSGFPMLQSWNEKIGWRDMECPLNMGNCCGGWCPLFDYPGEASGDPLRLWCGGQVRNLYLEVGESVVDRGK